MTVVVDTAAVTVAELPLRVLLVTVTTAAAADVRPPIVDAAAVASRVAADSAVAYGHHRTAARLTIPPPLADAAAESAELPLMVLLVTVSVAPPLKTPLLEMPPPRVAADRAVGHRQRRAALRHLRDAAAGVAADSAVAHRQRCRIVINAAAESLTLPFVMVRPEMVTVLPGLT